MDQLETSGGGNYGSAYKPQGRFSSMDRNYNNDSAINLPAIINPYNMIQGPAHQRTLRNDNRAHNHTMLAAPNQPIKGMASHRPSMSNLLMKQHDTGADYQGFSVISQSKKLHDHMSMLTPHKLRSNSTLSHTASGMIFNSQADLHGGNGADSMGRVSPLRNYDSRNPNKQYSVNRQTINQDNSSMMIDSSSIIVESP